MFIALLAAPEPVPIKSCACIIIYELLVGLEAPQNSMAILR